MAPKRPVYDVSVLVNGEGDPVDHRIEITPGDQLRAEYEAKKNMLGPMSDAPMNHTTVWWWCALTRLGLYSDDYQTFRNRDLYAMGGEVDPDPTPDPTGLSGSSEPDSSSPLTSPEPPTGSTPASTT